jgi:hypothetical protein
MTTDTAADIISRLRAENARLREAGQAVVGAWELSLIDELDDAAKSLRAALKEGAEG